MSWEFFRSQKVTARKAYRCAEADCAIEPGDRHAYHAGKVEGYFDAYRLCEDCALLSSEMLFAFPDDYDEGFPLTQCRVELRDEHGVTGDPIAWARQHRADRLAAKAAAAA